HPEVHDQDVPGVEMEQQVLPTPFDLGDLAPVEPRREIPALRMATDHAHRVLRPLDLGGLDATADHVAFQVAAHDLHPRKLHSSPYASDSVECSDRPVNA